MKKIYLVKYNIETFRGDLARAKSVVFAESIPKARMEVESWERDFCEGGIYVWSVEPIGTIEAA